MPKMACCIEINRKKDSRHRAIWRDAGISYSVPFLSQAEQSLPFSSKLIQQPHNCPQLFRLHLIRELAGENAVFEVLDLFCVGVALGQIDGAGIAGCLLGGGIDAAVVFIDFAFALFVGNERILELEAVGSAEWVSGCVPGSFGGNEEAGKFVYSGQIVLIRLLCAVLQGSFRFAEGVYEEVKIMDVQVVRNESASLFVHHPVFPAPGRIAAEASHVAGQKLALFAGIVKLLDQLIFGPEAQNLCDHEADIVFLCGGICQLDVLFF